MADRHTPQHVDDPANGVEFTRRRSGRRRSVLALGTLLGLGLLATTAAFSDSAEVTANFTAGTLDITVNDDDGAPTPYVLSFSGADAMVPGQTVHTPLTVANVGTVDADLSMSAEVEPDGSSPNATDSLRMVIAHTAGAVCDASVIAADTAPYSGDAPVSDASFDGVPLSGGQSIDLCIAVTLPGEVTGTGGGSSDVQLSFLAVQAGL
jgi:predicted ribosomally synthesized peptide with SipW-like signal peptide